MLTRIFEHVTNVPLEEQTSLELTPFDEVSFRMIADESVHSTHCRSQIGPKDDVQEESGRDAPTSDQPDEQISLQAIWNRLDLMDAFITSSLQDVPL